jgi:outer membrane protein
MKRFSIFFLIFFAHALLANAQSVLNLSLQQARELGLQNRFDVKANQYEVDAAKLDISQSKQAWLPEVRMSAQINYNTQIRSTLIPAGFGGLPEPTLLALGAKNMSIFSLELKQSIYNPTLNTDVKLAINAEKMEQERKREHDIEVKKQISQAYLNVLLRSLQNQIALHEEKRFREYYTLAEGRYKHGALIENDYLRAKLDFENAHLQATTSQQNYDLSLVTLRHELNVPAATILKLTDSLGTPDNSIVQTPNLDAIENRTEVRQLKLEEQANNLLEKRQRQAVNPVISLAGNYAQQFLNMDFNFNYSDGRWWSPYSAIGLQLSLPLTGQFTNRTVVQLAQLRSMQTIARQLHEKAKVAYEIDHAAAEVANALQNLQRAKSSYDLAQRVYKNQQQQLTLGAFSYDNVLNTEISLNGAERNYITATYDYMVTKLNYDVATGVL